MGRRDRISRLAIMAAFVTGVTAACQGPTVVAGDPGPDGASGAKPPSLDRQHPAPSDPVEPAEPPEHADVDRVPVGSRDDIEPRLRDAPDAPEVPRAAPVVSPTGTVTGRVRGMLARKYTTLVLVERIPGATFGAPQQVVKLDQRGKAFAPRVLTVLVGTTVEFTNGDDFEHNVFSPDGEAYNLGNFGQGTSRRHTFRKAGVYVQLCKLHPEMVGYVIVTETPYWAQVANDGTFRIPEVPAGTWKLKVWNERLKKRDLGRRVEVTVEPGVEVEVTISRKRQ